MKKRTVGRPREGASKEIRREILEAAEECFAAHGFAGATTRLIARRAAVNAAALSYHFGSKEGLYRAVRAAAAERATKPGAEAGKRTPAEELAGIVAAFYDAGQKRPSSARLGLFGVLAGSPPSDARDDARVDVLRGMLASRSGTSKARGLSPPVAARWIVNLIDGAVLAIPDGGDAAAARTSKAAVVLAALRVSGLA